MAALVPELDLRRAKFALDAGEEVRHTYAGQDEVAGDRRPETDEGCRSKHEGEESPTCTR